MKFFPAVSLFLTSVGIASARSAVSPIGKVIQLISDLQAKVVKEGEETHKIYAEYSEWCEDRSHELGHEIKTASAQVETLKAKIAQEDSTSMSLNAKVDELSSAINTDEQDLKAASWIRETEQKDYTSEEAELSSTVSMLERATAVLEREMAKGTPAFLQAKGIERITQALGAVVQASGMNSADVSKLTALLQGASSSLATDSADDGEMGAPAAAIYEGHSKNIVATLKDLHDKAEAQLDDLRKKETANLHNFEMLKQSLADEIKVGNQDLANAQQGLAASGEARAIADGALTVTSKDLKADQESKAELHRSCLAKAEDYESETKSRNEELNAMAEAKKAIKELTAGADRVTYGSGEASFFQKSNSRLSTSADLANFETVRIVRDLARKEGSTALAQLARRMQSAIRSGLSSKEDPFGKVLGMIHDMINKLESEAQADASKKDYCDKELAETNAKDADKSAEIKKLSTKIDTMSSRSSRLKEEVAELQNALAKLTGSQAEMDKMRRDEQELFKSNKADLEQGLSGVRLALKILGEYYGQDAAHTSAKGAGTSIVGMLEVVESDFSKDLAEIQAAEEAAANEYDKGTKDNAIEKTTKTKDVEHKNKESTSLDKTINEYSADRSNVQAELDAVREYLHKIKQECIAVAMSYAERKSRYEAEIAGLKEALRVLESETAFLQRRSRRKQLKFSQVTLRGSKF